MPRFWVAVTLLFLAAPSAGAQTKTSGTANCAKPDAQHALPVGDRAGHSFSIVQFKCTWSKPLTIQGLRDKDGAGTQFDEISGNTSRFHGYYVDSMDNGDKGYYRYQGTAKLKDGVLVSAEDKWTLVGGTGKLKGLKGNGTCKGKWSPDGSVTWDCEGAFEAAK